MTTLNQLHEQLDRLDALDPGPYPVLSLYLDLRPDEHGRDRVEPFLRKELPERTQTFRASRPERESLEQDSARVFRYVANLDPAMNGLALFTCSGVDFFEAIPLAAPVGDHHHLVIADRPDLYPLTRVLDGYPRYLAVLADTHVARIFLFALNDTEQTTQIESTKTRRHKMGGWSQARYQRHVEHFHQQHAREVVDVVARLVRNERIDRILLAGNDVIMPLLRAELPNDLARKVIDVMSLDIRAGEREVLDATLASIHEKEAESDRERVDAMVAAFRAGGLACVGEQRTRRALERGQVHELLIAANADDQPSASDLVASARRTGARIRFIEDAALLEAVGGVGALLRFAL